MLLIQFPLGRHPSCCKSSKASLIASIRLDLAYVSVHPCSQTLLPIALQCRCRHGDDLGPALRPAAAYSSLPLSGHAQAYFYGFDIRLHLPEIGCISRLDVFSQAFDLFQDLRGGFGIVSDLQKDRHRLV